MKKLLVIIPAVVVLVLVFIFVLFPKKSTVPRDGKFGFLRESFNLDLEKIEDTGATWLRPNFGYFVWGEMQKDETSAIDFSKTDEIVLSAQKHRLHLLITVFPFADWDQNSTGDKCKVSPNDEMLPRNKGDFVIPGLPYYRCNPVDWDLYGKWLAALVERYDGDGKDDMKDLEYPVLHYEIGNEPDLTKDTVNDIGTVFYLDTPANYAELLRKSYTAIKSANPNVQVLPAAPAGVQNAFTVFWKQVFSTPNISNYFDIGNMHCLSGPNQDSTTPEALSAEDLNVTAYKNMLSSYNITKPIWVTEAENIQGGDVEQNVARLKSSVANALKNGAEKIFFTGASFANDPMRYTSEILLSERNYYKEIILANE